MDAGRRSLTSSLISWNLLSMVNPLPAPKTVEPADNIDVKQAVRKAVAYFLQLFPHFKGANVMLEEVEESDDGAYWLITIGYDMKQAKSALAPNLQNILGPQSVRQYKVVKIEAKTGRVVSMKIRPLK